ncbi:MAG: C-GCAxxG-C-C family (seleno)protein [Candidatus Bipolaricaulota bacterium]
MTEGPRRITPARAVGTFLRRGMCSQTLLAAVNHAYGRPMRDEERASDPLVGGVLQHGYQCGMLWGAALAAGAEAHRRSGSGRDAQVHAIVASRLAVEAFQALCHTADCSDITGMTATSTMREMAAFFFLQGGSIKCFRLAGRYAPAAFRAIDAALDAAVVDAGPSDRVSCSAVVASKLRASELHTVMASGLAGGIGLTGGGCGALGAAIWLQGLNRLRKGKRVTYKSPQALALVERFLKASDYEFECRKIVGHTFTSVAEHSTWLNEGGCAAILDVLSDRTMGET